MINLSDKYAAVPVVHSSKGNQLKWERQGIWYKADYTGYEGLSEYMVSELLMNFWKKNSIIRMKSRQE